MNNPDHYHYPHNFPSSPSYISDDSEDPYGESETDELHPSSDSELVSHPSDNEDAQSSQLHESDDSDDDGDDNDGDSLLGERDGFQFVGHSDLDALTRPRSALSLHSDHDPLANDMNFVYPSMTLSQECDRDRRPSLPPVDNSVQELATTTSSTATLTASAVIGTAKANEMERPDSHDPSAHDIPATLDSSLETISDQQQQQLSSEPSDNHNLLEKHSTSDDDQGGDRANNSTYNNDNDSAHDSSDSSENELDVYTAPPRTSKTPAHVALSEAGVTYADDHRLAVVNLNVYSSRLRQEKHIRRSPGFHVRVLNDNNLWSLQDAPAQPLYLFADPIVVCPDGGSCQVYVASLLKRHKKNASPWLCHDTGYYVHIWFSNGTRVPLSPPEIFTTRGKSDRKPLACLSPATFIGSHSDKSSSTQEGDGEDDYLAYWRERWQQMSGTISNRFTNKSQIAVYWDFFQPVVNRAKAIVHAVAMHYKQSTDRMANMLVELKGRLPRVNIKTNMRSTGLDRARSNAKEVQARLTSKMHDLGERIPLLRCNEEKVQRQAKIPMEEQVRAFKKAVEEQFDSITTDKILSVADDVLSRAEVSLGAILETDTVKEMAKTMRADEIKRVTERVVLKTEEQLDALLSSELARQVNRDLQRLVDDFKATPTGGKIVQEAQDIQSDAKRYFRGLKRKFRLKRLER
ncbi:hypothetical protein BGZ97_006700 [Linnemannia gamsii]|uniref:Uncharacterized protein n=1 Tax=Linnemannia gamsii TaxID=64522 RepID=A0A9P6RBF0_9FUNG|nr:hypothetical protein BGZ97_006700 [Linnemannia gamsii]